MAKWLYIFLRVYIYIYITEGKAVFVSTLEY